MQSFGSEIKDAGPGLKQASQKPRFAVIICFFIAETSQPSLANRTEYVSHQCLEPICQFSRNTKDEKQAL